MTPKEAKRRLKEMGVLQENQLGFFWIERHFISNIREMDELVACVKCLGAYSVVTEYCAARVEVTRGERPDQLLFRLEDWSE
jgi:hypothetical protein